MIVLLPLPDSPTIPMISPCFNSKLTEQLHQTFDKDERAKLAVKLQQDILDDDAFFFVSHLNMGIVTKSNVTGMAAHPCDYYEITADLDVE